MENFITYKSKVDWWLGIIIVMSFLMGLVFVAKGIWFFFSENTIMGWDFGSGLFIVLLIVGLVWPLYYRFETDSLLVRHGFVRSRYKYDIITGAKPSRNPLSSPALSLDRLKITYDGMIGFLLVSPKDKEGFMKELASRSNNLEYIDGEVKYKKA